MDADERARLINAASAATPMPQQPAAPMQAQPAPAPPVATPAGGRPGRGQPGTARIGRMGGPPGSQIAPQVVFGDPNNPFAVPPEFAGHEAPSGPPVRVRGARQVNGPGQGASVQMVNARPNPGATVQSGGVAMQGRAPVPAPVPTGMPAAAPASGWAGEHGIPRVATSAATRPTVDVTIILSQHRRPTHLDKQIRMIHSSSVAPASIACTVNPVPGVQINDGLLQGIPKMRFDRDMGPWWRWILGKEAGTKYVLMLDDDCVFGPMWLQKALERIMLAEQHGQKMVIAAGGVVFREDNHKSGYPIGSETHPPEEQLVDIGRGAWLLPQEVLRSFDEFPRLGSQLLTPPYHLAAVLQREQIPMVVLPYPFDNRAVWGMSSPPDPNGSTSQLLDQLASRGQGYPADYHREEAYAAYRAAGWRPLVVAASEETLRTTPSDLGPPPPVVAPPGPAAVTPPG